jgi:hypothetical protein
MFRVIFAIVAIVCFAVDFLLVIVGQGVPPQVVAALLYLGLAFFAATALPIP